MFSLFYPLFIPFTGLAGEVTTPVHLKNNHAGIPILHLLIPPPVLWYSALAQQRGNAFLLIVSYIKWLLVSVLIDYATTHSFYNPANRDWTTSSSLLILAMSFSVSGISSPPSLLGLVPFFSWAWRRETTCLFLAIADFCIVKWFWFLVDPDRFELPTLTLWVSCSTDWAKGP